MIKEIQLTLPTTLTRVSGNEYGKYIYETQVLNKIDKNKKNKIIFPSYIEGVGISFVKGLTSELVKQYGKKDIFKYFEFYSENQDVIKSIKESIEF